MSQTLRHVRMVFLAAMTAIAAANPVNSPLATNRVEGETIYVRTDDKGSQVEAIYELNWKAEAIEDLYFPIFIVRGARPAAELAEAKISAVVDGTLLEQTEAARAPRTIPNLPKGLDILWVRFIQPDLVLRKTDRNTAPVLLRVSYRQKSIGGMFYYLPIDVPNYARGAPVVRQWSNTMVVRSPARIVASPIGELDVERLGELLIVYLKDLQLVAIPTK